ncbi:hypothetical protein SLEP1_g38219 [Rubroshorea leprosula]|uniref:Uncharacterized protein n=1 Tax=Rubroshorea leprosula TaxID=152421 RepID=A0AAV5KXL0_9ROSI|nr:hypothetical protein SLEP1_g38219 [Rubroshorea leprosula]
MKSVAVNLRRRHDLRTPWGSEIADREFFYVVSLRLSGALRSNNFVILIYMTLMFFLILGLVVFTSSLLS